MSQGTLTYRKEWDEPGKGHVVLVLTQAGQDVMVTQAVHAPDGTVEAKVHHLTLQQFRDIVKGISNAKNSALTNA